MSVCPRGYFSALKSYYPFPTYQALTHAKKVCAGELPDLDGVLKVSNDNYISVKVPDINGFTRRHAEDWIDVCTKRPCARDTIDPHCRPLYKYKGDLEVNTVCDVNKKRFSNIETLYRALLEGGIVPFGQVVHNGKSIGILDTDKHFHICKPSLLLKDVNTIDI